MTIKTYTVIDGWADAQVTFSIDCEEIPFTHMQETCNQKIRPIHAKKQA